MIARGREVTLYGLMSRGGIRPPPAPPRLRTTHTQRAARRAFSLSGGKEPFSCPRGAPSPDGACWPLS